MERIKELRRYFLIFTRIVITVLFGACDNHPSFVELNLKDLSSFKDQAGNWIIVGDVSMDSSINVYRGATEYSGSVNLKEMLNYESGTGVLLNKNDKKKSDLITTWKHGDIVIKAEVMLAKGSNSGIYLQGRYEVQLLDSWGVEDPTFADIGGIYENWKDDPKESFKGSAPLVNAAKPPGIWQSIEISFRAPRFNSAGVKIENAEFKSVKLNGKLVQKDVEVPWPTGGALGNNEVEKGPLRLQGDHGVVAFKNIKYHLLKK